MQEAPTPHAHLFHDFAELAGILDARLAPVLSALGSCGGFGVEQACFDEKPHEVGLLYSIVAPFPVQLHRQSDVINKELTVLTLLEESGLANIIVGAFCVA